MHTRRMLQVAAFTTLLLVTLVAAQSWAPAENPLMTPFASDVGPDKAWPEHPRPQMRLQFDARGRV